ncbi:MAG: hypothetical protein JWQ98_996 [Chlorobi bacterium]|jgi:uncharacterized membrane protein|nr:hypothetical protein [Chlorobiota bacterium]
MATTRSQFTLIVGRMQSLYRQRAVATFCALGFASFACAMMVAGRIYFTGRMTYGFLLWNLLLAWVPFLISFSLYQFKIHNRSRVATAIAGLAWLAFFPNAPYIVTDFIHLRTTVSAPLWFDAIMIALFAWTGLTMGLISLRMMQSLVRNRFGKATGWIFALAVLCLSSYGVYLGRFERWNSWDILTNPAALSHSVLSQILNPFSSLRSIGVTLLFATFLTVTYFMTSTLLARNVDAGEHEF